MKLFVCTSLLLLSSSLFLPSNRQEARRPVAPEGGRADLPFSPGLLAGDFLYLSGAIGRHPERGLSDSFAEQVEQTFANLEAVVKAANTDLSRAVRSNVYLTDCRHYTALNDAYRRHFGDRPPVRATVESDLAIPGALIEISLVLARPGVTCKTIVPEGWPEPTRPYSWGIQAGDTLFVSGMVSRDVPRGELVLGEVGVQTQQVLKNVDAVLKAAGMDREDVVSSLVFLSDARDFADFNEAYRRHFSGNAPPARATLQARLMNPALRVEIQCLATRDRQRKVIMAPGASRPTSPFSRSLVAGGRQFLAGMVGRGPDGYAPGDVRAQTRQALEHLRETLAAAGLSFSEVSEALVILADVRHFSAMNEVYRELLPNTPPARTTIGAPLMSPDALVEIMMTATLTEP